MDEYCLLDLMEKIDGIARALHGTEKLIEGICLPNIAVGKSFIGKLFTIKINKESCQFNLRQVLPSSSYRIL